jgi:glycosyltransferase involved in cell wall biosynthesis
MPGTSWAFEEYVAICTDMENSSRSAHQAMRRPHVALVVPFASEFRRAFYERLEHDLDTHGITLTVAYGEPYNVSQKAREDSIDLPHGKRLRQRSVTIAGRPFVHKKLGELAHTTDVLVVDQALRNLELYPLLVKQWAGRGPVIAMWDHGRTYDRPQSALEQSLKYALTRRARWFFSYTEGGARAVTEHGFPAERVTVVQNALDTTSLTRDYRAVTDAERAEVRAQYGLAEGRTALYIGALRRGKRIDYLLRAAERIARRMPDFRLLVAGTGEDENLVADAAARCPAIVPVGQAFGARKAQLGAVADVLLVPCAVGLCVLDSFVLEAPLVLAANPWHGPEAEYLEDGRNAVFAPDDPDAYADAVVDLLNDPGRLAKVRDACAEDAPHYTIEEMSRRFTEGLVRLVTETRR